MWKWVIALVLVAALGGAAYYQYDPEGARRLLARTPLAKHLSATQPLYQWRDQRGQWQVSDEPPPSGTPYQVKQYPIDANVVPLAEPPKKPQ